MICDVCPWAVADDCGVDASVECIDVVSVAEEGDAGEGDGDERGALLMCSVLDWSSPIAESSPFTLCCLSDRGGV